jgi:GTP-binding protein
MFKIRSASFLKSVADVRQMPRDGFPQIAFAGRSNVGKSSLINYLLRRKGLAKTSKTPGKTRVINFFLVNDNLHFVDLPGYGYAKVDDETRRMWVRMLDQYFQENPFLRLVVWLLDVRREPNEHDKVIHAFLHKYGYPVTIALTKCDKLGRSRVHQSAQRIREDLNLSPDVSIIPTSVLTKTGSAELLSAIGNRLSGSAGAGDDKQGNSR